LDESAQAEISNNIGEIAKVIRLVENFGQRHRMPEATVAHFTLACDELLTNIISYGFRDDRVHKIVVVLGLEANTLQAEIIDDGIAFDPLAQPVPDLTLPLEERKIGGLGIHFVRTVMDRVDYRRSDGKNHLKMIKDVAAHPVKGSNP
jgi:serine/threonine-protein kinase RsbW